MKIRHAKMMHIPFNFLGGNLRRLCMHAGNVIDDFRLSSFSFSKRVLLIGITFGVMTAAEAENVTIHPANPVKLESVIARAHVYMCEYDSNVPVQIMQVGTTIRVDFFIDWSCSSFNPPPPAQPLDIKLGQFLPGIYSVDFFQTRFSGTVGPDSEVRKWGSAQFTVTDNNATKTGPFPLVDYTDHWWNPQESGMGFSIMQHPSDRIFAAWFVYDQAGQPTWYTLQPGQWLSPVVYTGPIYKTTGTYLGAIYNPGQLVVTPVGTGTFIFWDSSNARFTYTVEGKEGSKDITRLSF